MEFLWKYYRRGRRLSSILIGLVFFFAGAFKILDPVGAGLVVEEYLRFFHMGWLVPVAKPLGVILSLLETVVGVALVTGVYRKVTAITASVLIVFFTIVTFILWRKNPSMDCGCFGEVIHLTHAQTLLKNVVLLVLGVFAFLPFSMLGHSRPHKQVAFWVVAVSCLVVLIHTLLFIPLLDFTPFNLSSRLAVTRGDYYDQDEVTTYIYERGGKEGTFTLDKIPDSTWTFVRLETRLKEDNIFETDYPELSFRNTAGEYCDETAAEGRVLVVSVENPSRIGRKNWTKIASVLRSASDATFVPLLLVAGDLGSVPLGELDPMDAAIIEQNFYTADHKTLLSLNRSNGGAVYFNDGNLIRKWSRRNLPGDEDLDKLRRKDATDVLLSASSKGRVYYQAFFLYAISAMALL